MLRWKLEANLTCCELPKNATRRAPDHVLEALSTIKPLSSTDLGVFRSVWAKTDAHTWDLEPSTKGRTLGQREDSPRAKGGLAWWQRASVLSALGAFAAFVAVVLTTLSALFEPDNFAYRASIGALSEGHILLTNAKYLSLPTPFSSPSASGPGFLQRHHMASGYWISEKNPAF